MAAPTPSAQTLQSWEDAFQHPLPVVRRLETHLRRNIDDNRAKLRVLVGASYRDLLGTAERIIEMHGQMQRVETLLGDIGTKCNGSVVERIVENDGRRRRERQGEEEKRALAMVKVLRSCLICARRIVKARGDALLAAKLFVLSRLLQKSIGGAERMSAVLGDLQRRLQSLRGKLLAYIENDMATISPDTARLPHTLGAYVLVASATPKDALRYFLQVRYDQLDRKVDSPTEAEVLESLALWGQTLVDTRELFPRKVGDVLGQLSKNALLQDGQVTSLAELNLDIYGSWIPDDIRGFTPWVRHDQLVSTEVADALEAWTQQARSCLLERLGNYLENQTEARTILDSRQRFISTTLDLSSRVKNVGSAHGIDEMRAAFLSRLSKIAEEAAGINDLTLEETSLPPLSVSGKDSSGIWDLASEDFDLSNGGIKFRRSIISARHGRNETMADEINKLNSWTKKINESLDIADDMAATKWEDDLDFDSEYSGAESLQNDLAKQDPEMLRERLRQAIQASLAKIIGRVHAAADSTKNPAFLLRMWREVDLRRRALELRLSMSVERVQLRGLYGNVASMVLNDVIPDFVRSITASTSAAVALWEGSPALPIQCSPQTFRFLTRLHREMVGWGSDLWTLEGVVELHNGVLEILGGELGSEAFTRPVEELEPEEVLTNGHSEVEEKVSNDEERGEEAEEQKGDAGEAAEAEEETPPIEKPEEENEVPPITKPSKPEIRTDQVIQNLFDTHYLLAVFRNSKQRDASNVELWQKLIRSLRENSQLDDASHERLKKSAGEFWKKTFLLFGLLAPAREGEAVG